MKKLIYTLSFVALISMAGKSQTDKPATKQEPAKREVATPAAASIDGGTVKEDKATDPKGSGTRMAINEKGVPATKATTTTKDKTVKEEKPANPGQPAATDRK